MQIQVGKTIVKVSEFYPYRYPNGKMVLRFIVKEEEADFHTLYELLNENKEPIQYYENETDQQPKCVYYNYSEFTVNYIGKRYEVEQVTPSTMDAEVLALKAKVAEQEEQLEEQARDMDSQAIWIEQLEECLLEMSTEVYATEREGEKDE